MSAHVIHRGLQQLENSHRELASRIAERLAVATQQNAAGNTEAVATALRDIGEAFATSTAQIDAIHVTAIALVQQQVPLSAFAVVSDQPGNTGEPENRTAAAPTTPVPDQPDPGADTLAGDADSVPGAAASTTGAEGSDTAAASSRRGRTVPAA